MSSVVPSEPSAPSALAARLRTVSVGQWIGIAGVAVVAAVTVWAALGGGDSRGGSPDAPGSDDRSSLEPSELVGSHGPTSTTTTTFAGVDQEALDAAAGELLAFLAERHGSETAGRLSVEVVARPLPPDPSDTVVDELAAAPGMQGLGLARSAGDSDGDGKVAGPWDPGLATYDADDGVVVVAAPSFGPRERLAVLRALVHALHLHKGPVASDDGGYDSRIARLAVVEGDARRMQAAYRQDAAFAPDGAVEESESVVEEDVTGEPPPAPPDGSLAQLVAAAVDAGEDFMDAAERRGFLDEVLDEPPTTTEQVLHPERYRIGETALYLSALPPEGEVVETGAAGELVLATALRAVVSERDATEAADGWGGDVFSVGRRGERVHAGLRLVMDSSRDRTEMVEALEQWGRWHAGARVRVDGRYVEMVLQGGPERRAVTPTTRR